MAPISLVPTPSTTGYGLRATSTDNMNSNHEDSVKNIDVSKIDNKIVFFRFMGLEIKKVSVMETDKTSINSRKRDKFDKQQQNAKRPCDLLSNAINCDTPRDSSFVMQSTTKRQINKATNQSDNMIDSHRNIKCIKECSVMIIGEKCRICGKSFKCIKDVELHTKKKHRSKKLRRKHVVLKIGDEVMGRVSIKRKHLKRSYRVIDREILHDDLHTSTSCIRDTNRNDRINEERLVTHPLINVEDICDIADTACHLTKIDDRNVLLSSLGQRSTGSSSRYENNDDEEIKEVLRIRRSPKFGPSINHETPNRTERELLLSDAIREFDRIDNDPMDIFEFTVNDEASRNLRDDVIEDYCWLADQNLRNDHLDLIENNCSYHIKNDYDIDVSFEGPNSLIGELDPKYFTDENIYSKEYRKANGDIIPDYIDYTQCLNDNYSRVNNNNNKSSSDVYNIESSFYNEAQISKWSQLTKGSNAFDDNVHHKTKSTINLQNVIKEEIIFEDAH